ncbi:Lmo0850 family protein [Domibacillus epiphyticus]|uniref:Lmo0850 family protein n=1 Tax=Domibacillus epiphyticus TaxID=1714355 RepID=UPI00130150E9|nr:Lmo0850 family protein [Domibacillus epiphyticus]
MKSADRTRKMIDKISRLGVKATVTKSRVELWNSLQSSRETAGSEKVITSYHPG